MARSVATTRAVASRRRSTANFPYSMRHTTGTTSHVVLDTNIYFDTTLPFAASIWINMSDYVIGFPTTSTVRTFFCVNTNQGVGFAIQSQGLPSTPFHIGSAVSTTFAKSAMSSSATGRALIRGGWRMITVVYDGVDYQARSSYAFYVDDTAYALIASSLSTTVAAGANYIGQNTFSAPYCYETRFRVWSGGSVMTAAQVADLFFDDTKPSGPTLIREYLFTEGSGTTVADTAGGGFNGTFTNSPTWSSDTPRKTRTVASTVRTVAS